MTGNAGPTADRIPQPGDVLAGKYRVERVLGEGGMGIVFAAHHELLEQRVAIKLLLPEIARNTEAVSRFLNEARAASRIQNEHVARVMDVGRLESGLPYMVIEFLEGLDLSQVLAERKPLAFAEVVDWLTEALEAVAQAHALGIVHRDLKPSNLFLAKRQDGTGHIKVLDFGISKALSPAGASASRGSVTSTNAVLGSPAYMSPEQLRDSKSVDARADVWSMGIVAYELLTDGLPFDGDNVVALFAAIQETPPRRVAATRPDVPPGLDAAIQRCLRVDPAERFPSVTELAFAIAPFGTRAAALACERTARILPRTGADPLASTLVSSQDIAVEARTAVEPAARKGRVETEAPWATPRRGPPGGPRKGVTALVVAAAVVTLGVLVASGIVLSRRGASAAHAPPASTDVASSTVAFPPVTAAVAGGVVPSSLPSIAPLETTSPAPPSGSAATGATTPAATATASHSAKPAWMTAPVAPTKPKANCNPPTYVDSATGLTRFKPECLN